MTDRTAARTSTSDAIAIRAYADEDEAEVLDLLTASLGGGPAGRRPAEFFRWKHIDNPFGRSLMLVAEADGRLVGLRAFMRWRFQAGALTLHAVRAVDTATHPDHQGRGIFSRLTRTALDELKGSTDFVFNTPNDKSLPGYLKMGWRPVGSVPVYVRVARYTRFAAGARRLEEEHAAADPPPHDAAPSAREVLADPDISDLLLEIDHDDGRIMTERDLAYLEWRYGDAPLLDYRAVTVRAGGRLRGTAFYRVRPRGPLWEATVSELLVRSGDRGAVGALLREIRGRVSVDHLTWTAPEGWTARTGRRRSMSLRAPGGMTLVANPITDAGPDPLDLDSWALTLGDLEVF